MNKDFKLSYDDVAILPSVLTSIRSRSQCNVYDENGFLPIFASPMDTVLNERNLSVFLKNKINIVIPRTIDFKNRLKYGIEYDSFIAISMDEAVDILNDENIIGKHDKPIKICIDIANGHMSDYIELLKQLKIKYSTNIILMGGNIANPKAYKLYNDIGCDYIRCGIGGGDACLTTSNTGIHCPYFSLIEEVYRLKQEIDGTCKIIADGNIRGYRDIQKALNFADYVMIGSLFNKSLESAGKTTYGKCYWVIRSLKIFRPIKTLLLYGREVNQFDNKIKEDWKKGKITLFKEFYGMSTKKAQKNINPNAKKLKTSEGLVKYQKVEYLLDGWTENEIDYLKSAMSYTDSHDLNEYKDNEYVLITKMRFNN